jgi:predicted peroxiredoxin
MNKKFLVIISHSTDDHDRANLALAFVASMLSENLDVALLFMWEGALLGKRGVAETIVGRNMTAAKDLFPLILEAKPTIMVCAPCAKTMGVSEADLIPGAKLITAPTVVAAMQEREVVNF